MKKGDWYLPINIYNYYHKLGNGYAGPFVFFCWYNGLNDEILNSVQVNNAGISGFKLDVNVGVSLWVILSSCAPLKMDST